MLKGLGWGGMPLHAVRKDLEAGRLAVLSIEDVPPDGLILAMSAVWQTKSPPGPAGRWFVDRLKQIPVEADKVLKPPVNRKKAKRSAKT
ncbi:LysR substrate-binding domain-containing protein [Bradyrhizobium erythrophlei]|uniref:LysR substrate-binding domain-containing protein n=1 Tax=Bradyrhizobium erythrophlei TaxID=1437360 RepID=UPI0035E4B500